MGMWHPTKGYTALGYFMTWLFYMLIALPGVIFYIWSLIEDEAAACEGISGAWLFTMWSKTAGLYGSWILKQQLMDKCAPKEEAPVAAEVPAEEEVVEESIEEEPTVDEGNDWD